VLGQALGLTKEEFDALQGDYRESSLFDEREKAVLAWSEAMTLNAAKRDNAVWEELLRLFDDAEIVEISMACAMFNMINRLNDSFQTELEPEEYNRRQRNAVGVTSAALDDYACRVCSEAETTSAE
jgi:alkylhydroperoxidase family enzyme